MLALEHQGRIAPFHAGHSALDVGPSVGQDELQRQFRLHRHHATLDAATHEAVRECLARRCRIEPPASGLAVDVGKEIVERIEADLPKERELDQPALHLDP